jgi:arginine decarboxylase
MNRNIAPLFERMIEHYGQKTVSFHVPGHKSGAGLDDSGMMFLHSAMSIDFTEIDGLDDLHHPHGVILEAQQLAADCFGAEHTFFLVNGSTVGNLAMISAVCARNDLVIVQRNVHKSIIHAMMLAGVRAVFITPRFDEHSGAAASVCYDDISQALDEYPQAKAVILTNPTYYGMGANLRDLAQLAHAHGKPLLVDEAHGAHYGFHPALPDSALCSGADVVVQSTHKMLTAMTMGAMLHLQGELVDREAVAQRLNMLQSSSPSYPIMASLDLCRRMMHIDGERRISQGLQAVNRFKRSMSAMSWFRIAGEGDHDMPNDAYETKDPFKLLVKDATNTFNGFELARELKGYGCISEMADQQHVLLVFSLATSMEDADRLAGAFSHISTKFALEKKEIQRSVSNNLFIPQTGRISPPILFDLHQRGFRGTVENVRPAPLNEAVNAYAAEMVIPYPPGIPILYSGEIITPLTAEYLMQMADMGAKFHGVKDPELKTIQIFI